MSFHTTPYALRTGIGTEANPFLRKLFDKFGHEVVLLVTKGAFIVFLWFAYPHILAAGPGLDSTCPRRGPCRVSPAGWTRGRPRFFPPRPT